MDDPALRPSTASALRTRPHPLRIGALMLGTVCFLLFSSAPGAAITHAGASDPTSEGWSLNGLGTGTSAGAVPADPAYPGVPAWSVQDVSTVAGSYAFYEAPASEVPGAGLPWHLHARLRVVSSSDAVDLGTFVEVTDGDHLRYLVTFGSDAAGNTIVHVSSNGQPAGSPTTYLIVKQISGSSETEYIDVDLTFEGTTADLFVNGILLSSGLPGFNAPAVAPRVIWGSGSSPHTGHGHFAELSFTYSAPLEPNPFECSNGLDDDGDTAIDHAGGDADCASPNDPYERAATIPCDDGVDSDGDGLCNVDEARLGTQATVVDSDGDGLADGEEIAVHGTNPAQADSDGDGFDDDVELAAGRDPNDAMSGPPPGPAWDYEMPSRFVLRNPTSAPGPNGEDVYLAAGIPLHPTSWTVAFDACATSGLVFEYRWYVDGALVGSQPNCAGFEHEVAEEGIYQVQLVAVGTGGEQVAFSKAISVKDHLIFGIGDSYASGEGNPDLPITQSMLDQYDDSLAALAQAQSDAQSAYNAWQAQLALFNDLIGRVNLAYARLNIWQDKVAIRNEECLPFPSFQCPAAQVAATIAAGDLIWALGNIGLPDYNVSNLPSFSQISAAIAGVYNAGLATYQAFLSAWNFASTALQDTQDLVDTLEFGLVAEWQNEACHRSAYSGQVQAAKRIEESDPHSSVTFVHLACSGARIDQYEGKLIGANDDPADATNPAYQVGAMRAVADGHKADAVFVSIGGNDANFARVVAACVTTEPCYVPGAIVDTIVESTLAQICSTVGWFLPSCPLSFEVPELGENAKTAFDEGLAGLWLPENPMQPRSSYQDLADWLQGELPTGTPEPLTSLVDPANVFLTEYPDFIGSNDGSVCGWVPNEPLDTTQLAGFTTNEALWARSYVVPALATAMLDASNDAGWTFVSGISSAFATHGYCASDNWVVRIGESLATQADEMGIVHPDRSGHLAYADAIESQFVPEPGVVPGVAAGFAILVCLRERRDRRTLRSPTRTR